MKGLLLIILLFITKLGFPQSWLPLGAGVNDIVRVLYFDSTTNKLYVGGSFTQVDSLSIKCIAKWDGNKWDSLAGGMESGGSVNSIIRFQDTLYAGGMIDYAFYNGIEKRINGLAKWNGVFWDSIPNSFHPSGSIWQMKIQNGLLYLVGAFDSVANFRSKYTVAFDGNNWLSIGIPNVVYNSPGAATSCVFYNNEFYIGGSFNDSSYSIFDFASFDNNNWINHCSATACGKIDALAVYNNEIYLSGIYFVGPGQHIMKYDGTTFSAINGDLDWRAFNLKVINNLLFAVGGFNTAGGLPASKIAFWDGQSWHPFSNDIFDGDIVDIEVFDNELYVAGGFRHINNISINGIAKYSVPLSALSSMVENYQVVIYPNPTSRYLYCSYKRKYYKHKNLQFIWKRKNDS